MVHLVILLGYVFMMVGSTTYNNSSCLQVEQNDAKMLSQTFHVYDFRAIANLSLSTLEFFQNLQNLAANIILRTKKYRMKQYFL